MSKFYLAGPMTGYPQFNFPAFHAAAKALRAAGIDIVSPAELDEKTEVAEKAMKSQTGDLTDAGIEETWGDLLARDVKLVADEVDGIIFLPGWQASRGARLEGFVGILCEKEFYTYCEENGVEEISAAEVGTEIFDVTI